MFSNVMNRNILNNSLYFVIFTTPKQMKTSQNKDMLPKTFTELIHYKKKNDNIKFEDVEKLANWSKVKRIHKFNNPNKLNVNEIIILANIYEVTPEYIFDRIMEEHRNKPY